ncbi:MAG: heme-copper oxidase subunit III [Phycisphaerae bacterium]
MIFAPLRLVSTTGRGDSAGASGGYDAGRLGMRILLLSLSILFAATLVLYAYFRVTSPDWAHEGASVLPRGLWISTLILVISSGTMSLATFAVRRDRLALLAGAMSATLVLGCGFLLLQYLNWVDLHRAIQVIPPLTTQPAVQRLAFARTGYGFFYLLTALHAAHVLGGLVPMMVVTISSFRRRYHRARAAGVRHCAAYWHFLDVVWLILYGVLAATN